MRDFCCIYFIFNVELLSQKGVNVMEKYTVINVSNNDVGAFKKVRVKDKKGGTDDFYFDDVPSLKSGTTIKVYKNLKNVIFAYSCKVNGRQFVRLPVLPCSAYSFVHFYDALGSADACALDQDICSVLKTRGIKPTMNKISNLRLFVTDVQNMK